MALVKPSFSLQSGITLTNPAELEYYSGPWMGTTLDAAIQAAKDNIPNEYRYHGMKIKLLVVQSSQPLPSPPFYNSVNALNFTSCKAYTYWFSEGITNGNLVPFSPDKDAGVLGNAAGSTNEIQFNKNGVLSASSGLKFDPTKSALTSSYVVATTGFSGSLTKLSDGTSYLIQGTGILISSGTNGGGVTISSNAVTNPAGSNTQIQFNNGDVFGASSNLTFNTSTNTLTSNTIVATKGLSGSLTQISSGVPYLVASSSGNMSQVGGISISTGSNGQVSASYYVYPDDITVYLSNGKYFGRYPSESTIPAKGKTPAEVLKMAMLEPIPPELTNQTQLNQTIDYNQPSHSTNLRATFIKGSYGGSTQSQKFWWKRNGSTNGTNGNYVTIDTKVDPTTPNDYSHNVTNGNFLLGTLNDNLITYKFDVLTSTGETSTSNEITVTMKTYVAPTVTLDKTRSGATIPQSSALITTTGPRWALSASSANVNTTTFPFISQQKNLNFPHFPQEESFNYRMKGNVSSSLGFSATKNSPYVPMLNYSVNQSVNGGAESTILASTAFNPNPNTNVNIQFDGLGNFFSPGAPSSVISTSANSVTYKIYVSDERYSNVSLLTETITFDDIIYAGVWSYTTSFNSLTVDQKEYTIKSLTPYKYFASKIMSASGILNGRFFVPVPTDPSGPSKFLVAIPSTLILRPGIDPAYNRILDVNGVVSPSGRFGVTGQSTITLYNRMLLNNSNSAVYSRLYNVYLIEPDSPASSNVIYQVDLSLV